MIKGGGWSGRAEAQRRPRVSKLRPKGLSDYHSSETVVEAASGGPMGRTKGLFSQHAYSKGRAEKQIFT